MKKVLVTGASGFVGSHVVQQLLARGFHVIASSSNNEKASRHSWFNQVTYKAFDLHAFDADTNYFDFFSEPDYLIHLAWEGLPNYTSDFHINTNLPVQKLFIENMVRHGLTDLTVTGTCLEYGMKEGCLDEEMQALPSNPYAYAKNELRLFIESLSSVWNFDFKWIRLFYLYGPGQNPKSLISQLSAAIDNNHEVFNMSGGEQVRDFLQVSTAADYITSIALQQQVNGIVNCCSGIPVSVMDFILNYLKERNVKLNLNAGYYPYPDYEPMSFWGSTTKLRCVLNSVSL